MADPVAVPRTAAEAAALLGVPRGAPATEVERAYREQVTRCHPDRVAGLHPAIQGQAEGLTVALNAARDLCSGRAPRAPRSARQRVAPPAPLRARPAGIRLTAPRDRRPLSTRIPSGSVGA